MHAFITGLVPQPSGGGANVGVEKPAQEGGEHPQEHGGQQNQSSLFPSSQVSVFTLYSLVTIQGKR